MPTVLMMRCGVSRRWLSAGGQGELAVRRQLWSAIDLVVHLTRRGAIRRVEAIATVDPTGCREVAC